MCGALTKVAYSHCVKINRDGICRCRPEKMEALASPPIPGRGFFFGRLSLSWQRTRACPDNTARPKNEPHMRLTHTLRSKIIDESALAADLPEDRRKLICQDTAFQVAVHHALDQGFETDEGVRGRKVSPVSPAFIEALERLWGPTRKKARIRFS